MTFEINAREHPVYSGALYLVLSIFTDGVRQYLLAGLPAVEGVGVVFHEERQVPVGVLVAKLHGSGKVPEEDGGRRQKRVFFSRLPLSFHHPPTGPSPSRYGAPMRT